MQILVGAPANCQWGHKKSAAKAAEIANDLGAFSRQEKENRSQASGNLNVLLQRSVESFQQNSNSCMDCHANFASIASQKLLQATAPGTLRHVPKSATEGGQPLFASDYSFIFLSETKR